MLTLNCTRAALDLKTAARFGAAVTFSAIALLAVCTAAYADEVAVGGCLGGEGTLNCVGRWGQAGDPYVRIVPAPANQEEQTRAAEREHQWEKRCKPVVAQDRYGVARYQYSAPGCEFGILN